jgi:hypothetical protein
VRRLSSRITRGRDLDTSIDGIWSGCRAAHGGRSPVAFVPPLKKTPFESQYIDRSTTMGTPFAPTLAA